MVRQAQVRGPDAGAVGGRCTGPTARSGRCAVGDTGNDTPARPGHPCSGSARSPRPSPRCWCMQCRDDGPARPGRPGRPAPRPAGARRADRTPAAVAHRRPATGAVRRRLGHAARARTSTSCSPTWPGPSGCCRPAGATTTPTSAWRCSAQLVGRLRGGTWAEVLAERILDPLGLTATRRSTRRPGRDRVPGRRVLRRGPPGAADRLRGGRPRPPSCGAPRRTWPAGRPSWPTRPRWTRPVRCSPRRPWTRCAGR